MNTNYFSDFDRIQSAVIEQFKEGIIILSHKLKPIYLNQKAREICQQLGHSDCFLDKLPPLISDLLDWSSKKTSANDELFIMDYQLNREQSLRVRVHHFESNSEVNVASSNCSWLLLFLEDRNAILQDELKIEQKKYNLTDRELQVLNLLSHSYTYQEVAEALQITVNTVKFHAKNIYLKKQNCLEEKIFIKLKK